MDEQESVSENSVEEVEEVPVFTHEEDSYDSDIEGIEPDFLADDTDEFEETVIDENEDGEPVVVPEDPTPDVPDATDVIPELDAPPADATPDEGGTGE